MGKLSAKEYLKQLEVLDMQINEDVLLLSELKEQATCTGSFDYSKVRVQTSAVGDRLCNDVARYADFDEHINREVDQFVDAKNQIIREIRELRKKNYIQVLYKVYVQYKSVKVAAQEMRKSYSHTQELHRQALKAFETIHPNLHYLT